MAASAVLLKRAAGPDAPLGKKAGDMRVKRAVFEVRRKKCSRFKSRRQRGMAMARELLFARERVRGTALAISLNHTQRNAAVGEKLKLRQPANSAVLTRHWRRLRLLPGPEGCPFGLGRYPPNLPKPGAFFFGDLSFRWSATQATTASRRRFSSDVLQAIPLVRFARLSSLLAAAAALLRGSLLQPHPIVRTKQGNEASAWRSFTF
jgi:hypothetical protein